jgi:hypothetical protein
MVNNACCIHAPAVKLVASTAFQQLYSTADKAVEHLGCMAPTQPAAVVEVPASGSAVEWRCKRRC